MKIINGNLLDIEKGILCHQTNTLGIVGAGIALSIRQKWPKWYESYHDYCQINPKLGEVQLFEIKKDLYIANIFGQEKIGGHATVESSYDISLPQIKIAADNYKLDVFFPYLIGCGLGGGDWNIIQSKINKYLPNSTIIKYIQY